MIVDMRLHTRGEKGPQLVREPTFRRATIRPRNLSKPNGSGCQLVEPQKVTGHCTSSAVYVPLVRYSERVLSWPRYVSHSLEGWKELFDHG